MIGAIIYTVAAISTAIYAIAKLDKNMFISVISGVLWPITWICLIANELTD